MWAASAIRTGQAPPGTGTAGSTEGIGAPGQGPDAPLEGSSKHEHRHDEGGEDEGSHTDRVIAPEATDVTPAPGLELQGCLLNPYPEGCPEMRRFRRASG